MTKPFRRIRHRLLQCPICDEHVYTSQPRPLFRLTTAPIAAYELRRHEGCRNRLTIVWARTGRFATPADIVTDPLDLR